MEILYFMVPISIGLAIFFLFGFFWANKRGQFDDLVTPAHRMLLDDDELNKKVRKAENKLESKPDNKGNENDDN